VNAQKEVESGKLRTITDSDPSKAMIRCRRKHDAGLDYPLKKKSWLPGDKVFVDSMSDLFHAKVPLDYVAQVFAVMALADHLTFIVLTKRSSRMRAIVNSPSFRVLVMEKMRERKPEIPECFDLLWPLPNVWLGVSVEDQENADRRIPNLLASCAAVRVISAEPLLGPVDLRRHGYGHDGDRAWLSDVDDEGERVCQAHGARDCAQEVGCMGVDWVIGGGESGSKARPCHPAWARGLRDACQAAGVAFFWKQWGTWGPDVPVRRSSSRTVKTDGRWHEGMPNVVDDVVVYRAPKADHGRKLDGREWSEFPEEVKT
jgi:protein gp37